MEEASQLPQQLKQLVHDQEAGEDELPDRNCQGQEERAGHRPLQGRHGEVLEAVKGAHHSPL